MPGKRICIRLITETPDKYPQALAANAFNEGSTIVKTVPVSGEERTVMSPLCKLMIRLARGSPNPKPFMGDALALR